MPKSKRAKVVHLSKVDKKGKEGTIKLFNNVRESLDKYQYCFVFSVENMRNTYLKDVRTEFSDSRLFFGKTKVMAKALGTAPEDSHQPGSYHLSPHLHGDKGLLLTNRSPADVTAYFNSMCKTTSRAPAPQLPATSPFRPESYIPWVAKWTWQTTYPLHTVWNPS
ncbi:ribosomal protein L10-domain-containing protein [Bisporella sp. PMI_857]|nr:ribosomal protein L10-domain-containing protein [Bisporella sp. PMI_857]KAH8600358.1 ribosomal protein L10-domain-containing protein [Bisporella sp. PMI_857]